ncbi:MAG: outer membrane protein assembly factor BamA [Candidatus Omnitrophota bacterium]|nr:MAG: outer membrane protein assembly factor BamA [Candidatus Omnitrophota bacterium]
MKKYIFYTIILLFVFINSVFSQQNKRVIKEIIVENNKIVSEQLIVSNVKSSVGLDYSSVVLSDDIKRLYALGLFNDVKADVEDIEEGSVRVIFTITEKPVLEKMIFKGNRKIKTKKLLSKIGVKTKEIFNQFKLKEGIEELKKFYYEKGYALAVIDYEIKEKDSKVEVIIDINENKRIRIRKIIFNGNNTYSDKQLLKLIKTRKKTLFVSGFYKEEVCADDKERLIAFYQTQGFADVAVKTIVDYDQERTKMFVSFEIQEGKQYYTGQVLINGNTIVDDAELESNFEMKKAAIYRREQMQRDLTEIQNYYFDRGYMASSVKADTILNAQTGYIDVTYDVVEGTVAYVNKVNITGNIRTKDVVIRREMRLCPGDRYNGEKMRRSSQRLYNLGYFEEVAFNTPEKPTILPDKYDLDVFVNESKTGEFSFGAGYSSIDKFIGFVDLTQRNFDLFNFPTFTGGGQKLRMHMEFGADKKDYELGFIEPWCLGYPLSVGGNIYNRTKDWDEYDERRIGGNVFVGKEVGEYWQSKLTYKYEGVRISELSDQASSDIRLEEGKNYISSLTNEIIYDTRNNIYNATTGVYDLLSCEVGGGILGGDKDFVKYYTKNSKYFPVTKKSVFEIKFRGGFVDSYADTEYIPIYEKFYVGGANTIRGYKEREVGPRGENGDYVGGRMMFVFNAEYIYIIIKNLKWAFFYDIGNVWQKPSDFNWDSLKLKASIGSGVRVKTPLGPIRLDYGYALNPKKGDSRGRFHFSMSHEF